MSSVGERTLVKVAERGTGGVDPEYETRPL
jgi:hypothetical protein